jgi:hypothetical protein
VHLTLHPPLQEARHQSLLDQAIQAREAAEGDAAKLREELAALGQTWQVGGWVGRQVSGVNKSAGQGF